MKFFPRTNDLFDTVFDDMFTSPIFSTRNDMAMKTDITEKDGKYLLDMELPGFKKEEITVKLENGYLTIRAEKGLNKDEQDKKGRYIRQERYAGAMSRSFYVGTAVTVEDMGAKFENGILQITVPKEPKKELPRKNTLAIE